MSDIHENLSAIRTALEQAKRDHWFDMSPDLRNKVFAALAEPPRNCDVGTAREQIDRFNDFCRYNAPACPDCPLYQNLNTYEIHGFGRNECMAFWGQLPYAPEK